ncbi:MAG: aldo/keto reductase [Spongiibacteraceae bacterium]|jgi:diketogulonate reductase-like aldo/keto reductase|nr:aldo/keto reductase [Spongiibacteraceae bacterium]
MSKPLSGWPRRRVLKTLGGLSLGWMAGSVTAPGAARAAASRQPLLRTIPSSGIAVPAIGLGTARSFSLAGLGRDVPNTVAALQLSPQALEARLAPLRDVLSAFHAEGGRLVDSSPMYGTAEDLVGRFAAELGIGDTLFMATKVWSVGREAGIAQMEQSMRLLHSDPIDMMLIHNLTDWRTQYRTLRDWQEQGRIRHIGVSHSSTAAHDEVEKVLRAERFDALQINYNAADTHAEQRLLPLVQEQGLAAVINVPFGSGELFARARGKPLPEWASDFDADSWAQLFLKFVIGHPAVTCAIPATSKAKHARDNTRAMYGRMPDAGQRRQIIAHLQSL